jgi:hypothetical protein
VVLLGFFGAKFALNKKGRFNTVKHHKVLLGLFVALVFAVTAQTVMAQSTIFNIPSGDTVDKGKAYFEFDFVPQVPGFDGLAATQTTPAIPSFRTILINPRLVVGGPHDTEFGVNFPTFHTTASLTPNCTSSNCAYIEPNFKWKFYKNDDAGLAFVGGALLHTPMNGKSVFAGTQQNETWGLFYGNFTKKVKTGDHGPRVSAGPYVVADSTPVIFTFYDSHRGGVILGIEQPLTKKVMFVSDWYSGKNYYGYWTPGLSITLPGNGLFNAGYSIGNDSWKDPTASDPFHNPKNRYVFLHYRVTF